ncbi:SigB/SigF/SigG family RNA polymerase sigma factor [Pseudokineococcus sp. 1T1Z-3]|uniref:SigB/SigF/SigG family RNA polymerase sigma factor n=1 Tax=Pseudokineococcus sp. 1T1Z-3 TaxID=3132745 RepID=UPI0030A1583C
MSPLRRERRDGAPAPPGSATGRRAGDAGAVRDPGCERAPVAGATHRVPAPAPPPPIEEAAGLPPGPAVSLLPTPRESGRQPSAPARPARSAAAPAPVDDAVRTLVGLAGDDPRRPAARDRVVAEHLPLVERLARRYTGRGEPFDDLVQVGTIGLLSAVDRFDPARGVPLGAFAVPHVLGEIRRHFRDRGWAVRVPRRLQEHGRTVADARATLTQSLGRSPTVTEVATATGLDAELVVAALESAGAYTTVPLEEEPGTSRLVAEDTGLADVEDRVLLRPLLDALPARERRIIALRFVRGLSQAEIAAEVGLSQMHVSRLLARTLNDLRAQLAE